MHYYCLISIVKGLYPNRDVNDIDNLIELGKDLNFQMPSREGISDEEREKLKYIASLLVSPRNEKKFNQDDFSKTISNSNEACRVKIDKLLIDQRGTGHAIGPDGAPSFFIDTLNVLKRSAQEFLEVSWDKSFNVFKSGHAISNHHEFLECNEYKINVESFAIANQLPSELGDSCLNAFFRQLHPIYFCFDQKKFLGAYYSFLSDVALRRTLKIPNIEICCIYMVLILGSYFTPKDLREPRFHGIFNEYLKFVNQFLSEMVLIPSLDGIRCMLLLSIYFDAFRQRESCYILVELAIRQALAIGFHTDVFLLQVEDTVRIDEVRKTWWSLVQLEIKLSIQMDRPSCIPIGKNKLNAPILVDVEDSLCRKCYESSIKLSEVSTTILRCRESIDYCDPMLPSNLSEIERSYRALFDWYIDLDISLRDLKLFSRFYILNLNLKYHYYVICLCFPVLLTSLKQETLCLNETMLGLITSAIGSALRICDIVQANESLELITNELNLCIIFIYHATMTLVVSYVWLYRLSRASDPILKKLDDEFGITFNRLFKGISSIKAIKFDYESSVSSSSIISKNINLMIDTVIQNDESKKALEGQIDILTSTSLNKILTPLSWSEYFNI